jgi:hypothetical protein
MKLPRVKNMSFLSLIRNLRRAERVKDGRLGSMKHNAKTSLKGEFDTPGVLCEVVST